MARPTRNEIARTDRTLFAMTPKIFAVMRFASTCDTYHGSHIATSVCSIA
jgi:hypothetical protein